LSYHTAKRVSDDVAALDAGLVEDGEYIAGELGKPEGDAAAFRAAATA
jgi:hypothetical protein